jgi:colanic acid/amylovoran biosynthesis glycosyltransferase
MELLAETYSRFIIYRDRLLPPSETFIYSQAENLTRYCPYYVGSRRVAGLDLPAHRTITVNRWGICGRPLEALYRAGFVPPWLERSTRAIQPRLLHAHFGPDGAQALNLVKRLEIPLAVTFHGHDAVLSSSDKQHYLNLHNIYFRHRDELAKRADLIIAVSHFVKTKLLLQGFASDQIRVHYIGVDTELFKPRDDIRRHACVLFVGRLTESKGCDYLIRAMSIVQKELPHTELLIIGDGPLRSELERQAYHSLRRYRFLGLQSHDNVRFWMNRAQVVSVPSVTIASGVSEGFGMVALEAQAIGTPVAAFATGGLTEAVANGETGLFAPERDYEALAQQIMFLLSDTYTWNAYSLRARKRTEQEFSLKQQSAVLEDLYDDLCV